MSKQSGDRPCFARQPVRRCNAAAPHSMPVRKNGKFASYGDFDTKHKIKKRAVRASITRTAFTLSQLLRHFPCAISYEIKQHPEIGCIFHLGGCVIRRGEHMHSLFLKRDLTADFRKQNGKQNTGRKTSSCLCCLLLNSAFCSSARAPRSSRTAAQARPSDGCCRRSAGSRPCG